MIYKDFLNFHVVKHCTLKCVGCITKSDSEPEFFSDIVNYENDLKVLSEFMEIEQMNLMGGEPLLHPQIDEFIRIAKNYKLAKRVVIHTNGELLDKQSDYFWKTIDGVFVSLYPNTHINNEYVKELVKEKHKIYNYSVMVLNEVNQFVKFYTKNKDLDTQKIFDNCGIAKQCHYFDNGRYYKCIKPILDNVLDDGVLLKENEILEYKDSKTPLDSCVGCLGTSGPSFNHVQRPK